MVLENFSIGQMRSKVTFMVNNAATSASITRDEVITGGKNDFYSVLLVTRGRMRNKSGSRGLLLGILEVKDQFELICRFQSSLEANIKSDTKVVVDGQTYTIFGFNKFDEINHLYIFYLNTSDALINISSPTLGPELITNGGFTGNDNNWETDGTWFYDNNKMSFIGTGAMGQLRQLGPLTEATLYRLSFNITGTVGFVTAIIGSIGTNSHKSFNAGDGNVYFDAIWTEGYKVTFFAGLGFDGSITNVSVKKIL
jgi:hypothetical protein